MVLGILDLTSVFSYYVLIIVLNINVCCLWLPHVCTFPPVNVAQCILVWKTIRFLEATLPSWMSPNLSKISSTNPEVGYIYIYIYIKNSRIVFFPPPGEKNATWHKNGRLEDETAWMAIVSYSKLLLAPNLLESPPNLSLSWARIIALAHKTSCLVIIVDICKYPPCSEDLPSCNHLNDSHESAPSVLFEASTDLENVRSSFDWNSCVLSKFVCQKSP